LTTPPRKDRDSRKRRGLGLLLALALLLVLVILVLVKACGGDDDNGSSGGSGGAAAGSITAGGKDLIGAAAAGSIAYLDGKTVSANGVAVQSVVNETGFWVGTSETDRVFVETENAGDGTSLDLTAGDTVSFDGAIEKNLEAETYGLRAGAGAEQFRKQGYHVRVQADGVTKT
jgi:hypothetical protein